MAKDPRFNFYPDNYLGGTIGFSLEQHGAYMQLIMLNFYVGPFTEQQALDHLAGLTRGNTAVYTGLWKFLIPKFDTDGEKFWSGRLMKEKTKSEVHSKKQSERIKKRWSKEKDQPETHNGNTTVLPVMEVEMELELKEKNKKEPVSKIDERLELALNEWYLDPQRPKWGHVDFDFEVNTFREKVRGSPDHYVNHDVGGLRLAFQSQLRNAKRKPNGNRNGNKETIRRADATVDTGKDFGSF